MSSKFKKIINSCLMMSSVLVLGACNNTTSQNSGYDGRVFDISVKQDESITASLKKVGTNFELTISGVGEALTYSKKELVPWNAISKKINSVIINEGITNIGNYYFHSLTLDRYFIPSSVNKVEENSFNASANIYSYSSEEITSTSANKIYYYSEEAPSENDKYWHMVGENPVIWDTYKIMFIGNSFTYYPTDVYGVDKPGVAMLTKEISKSLGLAVEVDFVVKGSHTLKKFASETDEMGEIVDQKLKANNDYDYIILQEQSTTPVNDYNSFNAGVAALKEKINKTQTNCEIYLYATWGFPSGVSAGSIFSSVSAMEKLIRDKYIECAQENGLKVSHVGKAFTYVYENHKDINLYWEEDNKHQSYAGAYLAACVHLSTIFNVDVRSSTFNGNLSETHANTLKEASYNVVFK